MDKLTQLFIRACKSKDSEKRLKSVYRRFYYLNANSIDVDGAISYILAEICDKYVPMTAQELLRRNSPREKWMYGVTEEDSYWQVAVKIYSSKIRLTEKSKLKGLTAPARFRPAS